MSVLKLKLPPMMYMPERVCNIRAHHPRPTAPLIRPKQEGRILNKDDASDNENMDG